MGLFNRKKRDDGQVNSQEVITPPVNDVLLKALLDSQPITREQALTLPAVSAAVDFISNMIACMPVKLYKYKDGKVEEKSGDVRVSLLNGDTGDTLNGFQMKKAMVEDYLLGKGGYAYIRRNRNEVTGLFYVKDIFVEVIPNFKPIYKDYVILVIGEQYRKHEFIKLLRNTKDGGIGTGLTEEVGKALETAFDTLLYQLNMVKSGGNKKGFIESEFKLDQETINTLKIAWKNLYGNNQENVVVLNKGLKFQEAGNSAVEMQMNESKKTLEDEINNIFHIHPNDFYATFKEAIYPIIKSFESTLNRDLLLEKEKKNMFFAFDVKEIIKANITERFSAYKTAKEIGLMTINEMRKEENMNWIEGLDVINVGLGAVLYDTNRNVFFTPNTGQTTDLDGNTTIPDGMDQPDGTNEAIDKVIVDKELDTEFEQDGNSSDG